MALGTTRHFLALDGLRGVCACMIVLFHFTTIGTINQSLFVQHAFLFVDFFFVLSGFVIASSYGGKLTKGYSVRRFMLRRLGRIYPLHLFMLALFVGFELLTLALPRPSGQIPFSEGMSIAMIPANLALLQTFVGEDRLYWNGPAWSIAVEVWTYFIFALGFRLFGRFIVPAALVLALAGTLYLAATSERYLNIYHDGAFARCLIGFSLGVAAFHAHRRLRGSMGAMMASTLEIVATVATTAIVIVAGEGPLSLAVPPFFALVILLFAQQGGVVSRLLSTAPFATLGLLSYSIYLVHMFIVVRTYNALEVLGRVTHVDGLVSMIDGRKLAGPTPMIADALSLGVLAVTIAVAAITYRLIERPANLWTRRRTAAVLAAGATPGLVGQPG